jgi:hypothetical protein
MIGLLFQTALVGTVVFTASWFVTEALLINRERRREMDGAVQAAVRQCREYEQARNRRLRR